MSKYKKSELEQAIDSISDAAIIIAKIRDKEIEKETFKSAFVIDLEEVLRALAKATRGVDYISGNDY